MAENNTEGLKIKSSLKSKAIRVGEAILLGLGTTFGSGIEAKPVSADGPTATATATTTRTATPTGTPTPSPLEKEIAAAQATVTALQKETVDRNKLADLRATETALRNPPTITPSPVTRTPAEATATADAIRLRALGEEQARGKATATAQAELTTTTQARETPTTRGSGVGRSAENQGGGPPGILWAAALGALGVFGWFRREQIQGTARRGWERRGEAGDIFRRGREWVRDRWNRLRDRGGGGAPGPGVPPADPVVPPAGA